MAKTINPVNPFDIIEPVSPVNTDPNANAEPLVKGCFKFKHEDNDYDMVDSLYCYRSSVKTAIIDRYLIDNENPVKYIPYTAQSDPWNLSSDTHCDYYKDVPAGIKFGSKPCFYRSEEDSLTYSLEGSKSGDNFFIIKKENSFLYIYSTDASFEHLSLKGLITLYSPSGKAIAPSRLLVIIQAAGGASSGSGTVFGYGNLGGAGGGSGACACVVLNTDTTWYIKIGAPGIGDYPTPGSTDANPSCISSTTDMSDSYRDSTRAFVYCSGGKHGVSDGNTKTGGAGGIFLRNAILDKLWYIDGSDGCKGGDAFVDHGIINWFAGETLQKDFHATRISDDKQLLENKISAQGQGGEIGKKSDFVSGGAGGGGSFFKPGGNGGDAGQLGGEGKNGSGAGGPGGKSGLVISPFKGSDGGSGIIQLYWANE